MKPEAGCHYAHCFARCAGAFCAIANDQGTSGYIPTYEPSVNDRSQVETIPDDHEVPRPMCNRKEGSNTEMKAAYPEQHVGCHFIEGRNLQEAETGDGGVATSLH